MVWLMIIKDELYGTMDFNHTEASIIDTPAFQCLRRIKQMSFTNLVYPGANHTRFEHSLGTSHLSGLIAEKVDLDNDAVNKVRLYGLLHDIGHIAFSHEGEEVLSKYLGTHEEIGKKIITEGEIADILTENYNPREIAELGKRKEGRIVYSDLGADRMDYLRRDAQNTGVAYGVIDTDRIVHTLAMHNGELIIEEGGLTAAESLLIARFMMFTAVYLHRTLRIATSILHKAIENSIADRTLQASQFLTMGDEDAMMAMCSSPTARSYVIGLKERKLYKEIFAVNARKMNNKTAEDKRASLSKKINAEVLMSYPQQFYKKVDFNVLTGRGLVQIAELSELVNKLEKGEEGRHEVLFMCASEFREQIKKHLGNEKL